ncbi:hypothetical protein ACFL4T_03765, partial [candidate division KSB1 bacterium]
MDSLFPALNIFAILTGLITILIVIRLYLQYRFKYLLTFAYNISLFNIVLILFLPVNYLFGNSGVNFRQSFLILTILCVFLLSINILKYLWGYTFVLVIFQVLNKNISKLVNRVFFIVSGITLVVFTILFYFEPDGGSINYPMRITEIVTFQVLIAAYTALIYFYFRSKKFESGKRSKAVKMYSLPLIFIWSYVFITAVTGAFIRIPSLVEINIILVALSFNFVTAVILKSFVESYGDAERSEHQLT